MIWVLGIDPGASSALAAVEWRGFNKRARLIASHLVHGSSKRLFDERLDQALADIAAATQDVPPVAAFLESHNGGKSTGRGARGKLPPSTWIGLGDKRGQLYEAVRGHWLVRAEDLDITQWPKLLGVPSKKHQDGWHRCADAARHVDGWREQQAVLQAGRVSKAARSRIVDQAEAVLIAAAGLKQPTLIAELRRAHVVSTA